MTSFESLLALDFHQTFCLLRYDITGCNSYLNPVAVMKPEIIESHREPSSSWVRVANVVNTVLKKYKVYNEGGLCSKLVNKMYISL